MSARVFFYKNDICCKDVSSVNSEDGQVYSVYCNFLVLLSNTVCSQNINKQMVYMADENLTDYSFLCAYHHTKSI